MGMIRFLLVLGLFYGTGQKAAAQIDLQLTPVAGLFSIVDIKHPGDASNRLFLIGKQGFVHIVQDGQLLEQPFIDVSGLLATGGNEQGLLSMAFSPDYASDGRFYLFFTDNQQRSNITRFRVSQNPNLADPESAELIFAVDQPFANHNGGRLEFGPDGFLYLGIGDGGGAGDPVLAGQNLSTHLGKIIRIDVSSDGSGYLIPPDNPFVGQPASMLKEIWAYGVRNPWRMSFDRMTGDLYIADVGQSQVEEIDFQPANSSGGENYGWSDFEGSSCFQGDCDMTGKTFPVFEYSHADGNCSITGGQVYRGPDYANLFGSYLYGDFCSGRIWALQQQNGQWSSQLLSPDSVGGILTFGEDERGNIYVSVSDGPQGSGVFLLSDGPPVGIDADISINAGMAGAWFDPTTSGQGFLIDVEPAGQFMFVAWFTYDDASSKVGAPEHRWLTAQGEFSGSVAELTLSATSGGRFDDPLATTTDPVGSLTLNFADCSNASVSYDLPDDGLQGQIDIVRLIPGTEALCQSLDIR
jgi:glucose/arabinose dehydrogenase